MSVVRHFGKPVIVLLYTTNPNWPEIQRLLNSREKPRDGPDVCAKVSKANFNMLDNVLKNDVHGTAVAHSATIEWQKRGLTHDLILFIMKINSKPKSTANVDNY